MFKIIQFYMNTFGDIFGPLLLLASLLGALALLSWVVAQ